MIKYSDIEVTGSITVLGSITGSLLGTASYALISGTGASVTSSYSISASYAHTAPYAATSSHAVTSSYAVTASHAITASFAESASYADKALLSNFAITAGYAPTASHIAANDIGGEFFEWNSLTNPTGSGATLGGTATYLGKTLGTRLIANNQTFNTGRCFWERAYNWTTADIKTRVAMRMGAGTGDYFAIHLGCSGAVTVSDPDPAAGQTQGGLYIQIHQFNQTVSITAGNNLATVSTGIQESLFNPDDDSPVNVDVIVKWRKNTGRRICEVRIDNVWVVELDITGWSPAGHFYGLTAKNGGAANWHDFRHFAITSYQDEYSYWVTNSETTSFAFSSSFAESASNAYSASYASRALQTDYALVAVTASYVLSSSYSVIANYATSASYSVRANYATSASYADGAYVNFLSSGSGAIVQTSADIWESEMIRLDLENQTNPGRLVIGGSARNSYRTYYFPDEQTFPANINQNAYGISKYGTIKVGANAQGSLPLGNEDNGIPYINGTLDIAGTAGPNKRTPFGLGRAATIRDVVNSQGEFSFIHWGGDDGEGQRYEMTFSGGNKLRLVPAYYANNASIFNEIYQTNQSEAATSVLNYDSATRPWGYWSSRINQIFQWRVVRSGSNLVSQVRCNGSQNWVTIRTIAATTFQGMWDGDVTVNNWWAWQFTKGFAWSTSTNTFDNLYVKMSQSDFPMNM